MNSNGIGAETDDWGEVWNGELLLQERNTWTSTSTQTTGCNSMINTHHKK